MNEMSRNEAITIWPCGNRNGLPSPPNNNGSSVAARSSTIIGWKHKQPSTPADSVIVVAGIIPIVDANEAAKINNSNADHKLSKSNRHHETFSLQKVTSAIDRLSRKFVCQSNHCNQCTSCDMSSLQIIDVIANDHDLNSNSGDASQRQQLIFYCPEEAHKWFVQRHGLMAWSADDLWGRITIQVGLSLDAVEALYSILKDPRAKSESALTSRADEVSRCKCSNSIKWEEASANTSSFRNKSLLLLHWNGAEFDYDTCPECGGIQLISSHDTHFILSTIVSKVPILNLIKTLIAKHNSKPPKTKLHSQNKSIATYFTSTPTAIIIDITLGLILGLICHTHNNIIIAKISSLFHQYHNTSQSGLAWLQSNPGGVKMNEALTKQIGSGLGWVLHRHYQMVTTLTLLPSSRYILQSVGILTIIFGSRFFFALAFDMTRLVFVHIHLLSNVFGACQRLELSTLSSLWLLFRGKKNNILRHRSDHLHYDHMQLMLGMLLFSFCIFLFTTVLVHQWFFAVVGVGCELLLCGIWMGYMGVMSLFYVDKVLWDVQLGFVGDEVKLLPVDVGDEAVRDCIGNHCIGKYFNDFQSGTESTSDASKSTTLSPCISSTSVSSVVMKISFPTVSDEKSIIGALVSFTASKIGSMLLFLPHVFFASPCHVVTSCMDTAISLQQSYERWLFEQFHQK